MIRLIELYERFTKLADKKKEVFDDDLRILMGDNVSRKNEFYQLEHLQITSGSKSIPSAVVKIKADEEIFKNLQLVMDQLMLYLMQLNEL